ncbi:MAG TPA: hypothetical protein DCG57_16410 [Candidatus Riflebacteria bacterium]|jgi:hypothetical protein|nr:hypothetical protein [Candidatus Riflebacteria bacterium]
MRWFLVLLLALVSSPAMAATPAGKNIIIVSHLQNLMDCQGNAFITLEEGGVVVFKPLSNGALTTVGVIESRPALARQTPFSFASRSRGGR